MFALRVKQTNCAEGTRGSKQAIVPQLEEALTTTQHMFSFYAS
jgi:hypothetical protein